MPSTSMAKVLNRADDLSRESIRKAFSETKSIESLTGRIGWEGSGNAFREEVIIATWKDGKHCPRAGIVLEPVVTTSPWTGGGALAP